jgi:hypothetical protein
VEECPLLIRGVSYLLDETVTSSHSQGSSTCTFRNARETDAKAVNSETKDDDEHII